MLEWLVWLLSWALVLVGSLFIVAGGVGMVRLPDLYTRLHAASVTDTGGAIVLSFALLLQAVFVFGNTIAAIKVSLILFFTLFTAPTASHALAKSALLSGQVPLGAGGEPLLESPEEAVRLATTPVGADDDEDAPHPSTAPAIDGGAGADSTGGARRSGSEDPSPDASV